MKQNATDGFSSLSETQQAILNPKSNMVWLLQSGTRLLALSLTVEQITQVLDLDNIQFQQAGQPIFQIRKTRQET